MGAYGLAIANLLTKTQNNEIMVWSESKEKIEEVNKTNMLQVAFKDKLLPKSLKYTLSMEEAIKDKDIVFIVVAAQYVDSVALSMKPFLNKNTHVCICSKGIEQDTCSFVSDVFRKYIKTRRLAVISGPSFAIDIMNGEPVALTLASSNKKTIKAIKGVMCNSTLKLRETNDYIGVQTCGSIKNIIAIASGIISGLGYSDSTRAFLITEAAHDMKEIITSLGGDRKTILSYSGIGDLLLTCTSIKSRNFSYGKLLGEKNFEAAKEYLAKTTVEGYYTLKSVYQLIKKKKIKIPVIDLMDRIVMHNEKPELLIEFLINKK